MKLGGPLLLVGCGKMGGALLEGWLARGLPPAHVWIVEPNAAPLQGIIARGVHHAPDAAELPADLEPALMVFAVKPQMLAAALPHYRRFADPESPGGAAAALSLAAGRRSEERRDGKEWDRTVKTRGSPDSLKKKIV